MKNRIIIFISVFLLMVNCYCIDINENFIDSFFTKNYNTKTIEFDDFKMMFSYENAADSDEIITKGIFYSFANDKIIKHLVIDNETICNDSEILFKGIIKTQQFYGYKIKVIEKNKCISTVFCTDFGEHVTEGPTFLWNSKSKSFTKYEIDRSQF